MEVDRTLLEEMLKLRPGTPAGVSGPCRVVYERIPAGKPVTVVSMRNAIMTGYQLTNIKFPHRFTIRHLEEEGVGKWMSDSPQEVWQMATAYQTARGNVLCGGVGLGVLPHLLAHRPGVTGVVAVDRSVDICNLVGPYIRAATQVAEIVDFVKHTRAGRFDFAVFDTWQATSEYVWWQWVVPLRRLCRGRIKHVLCWQEEEMHGQMRLGMPTRAVMDPSISFLNPEHGNPLAYQEVFRRACQRSGIRATISRADIGNGAMIDKTNAAMGDQRIQRMLHRYLNMCGTDTWERTFGDLWDSLVIPPEQELLCPAPVSPS